MFLRNANATRFQHMSQPAWVQGLGEGSRLRGVEGVGPGVQGVGLIGLEM